LTATIIGGTRVLKRGKNAVRTATISSKSNRAGNRFEMHTLVRSSSSCGRSRTERPRWGGEKKKIKKVKPYTENRPGGGGEKQTSKLSLLTMAIASGEKEGERSFSKGSSENQRGKEKNMSEETGGEKIKLRAARLHITCGISSREESEAMRGKQKEKKAFGEGK